MLRLVADTECMCPVCEMPQLPSLFFFATALFGFGMEIQLAGPALDFDFELRRRKHNLLLGTIYVEGCLQCFVAWPFQRVGPKDTFSKCENCWKQLRQRQRSLPGPDQQPKRKPKPSHKQSLRSKRLRQNPTRGQCKMRVTHPKRSPCPRPKQPPRQACVPCPRALREPPKQIPQPLPGPRRRGCHRSALERRCTTQIPRGRWQP